MYSMGFRSLRALQVRKGYAFFCGRVSAQNFRANTLRSACSRRLSERDGRRLSVFWSCTKTDRIGVWLLRPQPKQPRRVLSGRRVELDCKTPVRSRREGGVDTTRARCAERCVQRSCFHGVRNTMFIKHSSSRRSKQ